MIVVENKLRNRLSRLTDYRKEGLTRLHHIRIYEKLRTRRLETERKRVSLDTCINTLQV